MVGYVIEINIRSCLMIKNFSDIEIKFGFRTKYRISSLQSNGNIILMGIPFCDIDYMERMLFISGLKYIKINNNLDLICKSMNELDKFLSIIEKTMGTFECVIYKRNVYKWFFNNKIKKYE